MSQLTIRCDEDLKSIVAATARAQGRSLNDYVCTVLAAATNPNLAGTEVERIRERLAKAGVLAELPRRDVPGPSRDAVVAAGRRAAQGRLLSEIISEDRG